MGQNILTPYAFYHLNKHTENQQVGKNMLMDLNHYLNPFPVKEEAYANAQAENLHLAYTHIKFYYYWQDPEQFCRGKENNPV